VTESYYTKGYFSNRRNTVTVSPDLKPLKTARVLILAGIIAAPIALVATFLMSPFWNWLEMETGIECMGHSGPADWCFLVIYLLLFLLAGTIIFRFAREKAKASDNPEVKS
jgi:H+/Cl- antiporter ClcA